MKKETLMDKKVENQWELLIYQPKTRGSNGSMENHMKSGIIVVYIV